MGNLKKSKKIIAFSTVLVVVLSCAVVLKSAFSRKEVVDHCVLLEETTFYNEPEISNTDNAFVNTSNSQTVDIGESEKGSFFKEAQREIIDLRLDNKIKSDDLTLIIKPAQIIKASPEFIEQARQRKEEFLKPATGLFDTMLEITPEGNAIKLDFSLRNISGESLLFYFSSGQKYDIFIRNHKGEKVYKWSHDKDFLMAIVDMELNKDEKLAYTEAWDYRDDKGNRVPPGKYSIVVIWLAKVESDEIISTDELMAVKDIEVN